MLLISKLGIFISTINAFSVFIIFSLIFCAIVFKFGLAVEDIFLSSSKYSNVLSEVIGVYSRVNLL
jgi:hypothetical protein